MKQLTILFFFLNISFNGLCDTLDYWHVYINDELIYEFNLATKELSVNLSEKELKKTDTITVRYRNDHPCVGCFYTLTVLGDFKRKAPEAKTNVRFGKLSISIIDLLNIQKSDGINKFSFFLSETGLRNSLDPGILLFNLTLKE